MNKPLDKRSVWQRYFQFGSSDQILFLLTLALSAFGLVMVYSSSYIYAESKFGEGTYYFKKHLFFFIVGFSALLFFRFLNKRIINKIATPVFLFFLIATLLTLIPGLGVSSGGASRWLSIGPVAFQPVEFLKISFILFLAKVFVTFPPKDDIKKGFLVYLVPLFLVVSVCLSQPDFGSSAVFFLLMTFFLFNGGVKLRYLFLTGITMLPLVFLAAWVAPYRRARLLTFLDPWADPNGSGFQIIQSYLAFYRGGMFGVGLGNSKEKVFYLPKAHNDFAMSVIGEELGFIGVSLLIFAFMLFIYRGYKLAIENEDSFNRLVISGLTVLIGFQAFASASVTLGLLPTKGMNLPFVSSGGSSLVSTLFAVGIILCLSVSETKQARFH